MHLTQLLGVTSSSSAACGKPAAQLSGLRTLEPVSLNRCRGERREPSLTSAVIAYGLVRGIDASGTRADGESVAASPRTRDRPHPVRPGQA